MRLSNFKLTKTTGTILGGMTFHATVDVETGMLWWKKKENVEIQRRYTGFWFFVATGRYTPGWQAERLARSWTAMTGQET